MARERRRRGLGTAGALLVGGLAALALACRASSAMDGPEAAPGLTLERTTFSPGESLRVRFTAPRYADDAWIGILPSDVPHGSETENDRHDVSYQYLRGRTSGEMVFTAPGRGRWDLRLHTTDAGGVETASVSFVVATSLHDVSGSWIGDDRSRCRLRQEGDEVWALCDARKDGTALVGHGELVGRTVTLRLAVVPRDPAPRRLAVEIEPAGSPFLGALSLSMESQDELRTVGTVPAGVPTTWRRAGAR
ncbi:MAG TPA: hypothetical protein VLS93_08180 [Anaeromyxobacteraceae bacterium]|nr:hypothetical protein [Anaeromyxobacteraceae bacterium]